jgi:hypothetical protein
LFNSDCTVVVFDITAIKHENPRYYDNVLKTITDMNEAGKTEEVQRAYYCRFVKGEKSYFDSNKVFHMFDKSLAKIEGYKECCDMGIDFGGQVSSRTVVTISTLNADKVSVRLYHKTYEVGKDLTLLEDVAELMTRFNIQRIIPDDCPAGFHVTEQMRQKGWPIHPMNFKADKVKKYGAFRAILNKGKIKSYEDAELRTEMLALEQKVNPRNSTIEHAPGYSDDLIDSFLMSCYFFLVDETGVKFFVPNTKRSTIL